MKLRLKGFTGIKAGPALDFSGCDEIEIDFTGRHGLTTFEGECGSGKSTVLECMHHYPQLVSRDGALWQHVFMRDAEKEFESTFMGDHYRSLIKIDAQSQKTEGYLWVNGKPVVNSKITAYKDYIYKVFGNPFTYFRSQFCPQKSKKTKDMQIENMTAGVFKELLSEFLYLQQYTEKQEISKHCENAIVAQTSQLSARVEALQEKVKGQEEARTAHALECIKAENLGTQKIGLNENLTFYRTRVDELKKVISNNALLEQRRSDITAQIEKAKTDLDAERKTAADERLVLANKYREINTELEQKKKILEEKEAVLHAAGKEKELQTAIDDLSQQIEQISEDIAKHQNTAHALEMEIQSIEITLKSLNNDNELQLIIENINSLQTRIVETNKNLELEIKTYEGKIKDLDNDQTIKDIASKLSSIDAEIAKHEQEIKTLASDLELQRMVIEIQNLEARVAERCLYEFSPGEKCQSTTCVAVSAAAKAEAELPAVREKYQARQRDIAEKTLSIRKTIDAQRIEKQDVEDRKALREKEIENERNLLDANIVKSKQLAKSTINNLSEVKRIAEESKASHLQKIETEKSLHSDDLAMKRKTLAVQKQNIRTLTETQSKQRQEIATKRLEIIKQKELASKLNDIQVASERKEDLEKQLAEVSTQGQEKKKTWETKESAAVSEIATLENSLIEIGSKISTTAADELKFAESSIVDIEAKDLPDIEKEISEVNANIASMKAQLATMENSEAELIQAKAEKEGFAKEVAEWAYLKTAIGKDIPGAEIEGAAPLIVSDANELLCNSYGTTYSIRLQTYDETTGKDCLNVKIITESGKEVDLDNISGGQRVWNIQSLWLAMSLLNQKKSNRQYDYFCADEQDGALDIENARKFAALYEPFMKIGGFGDLYFISHKPECRAMAQNTLVFEVGKNPHWN